jgi:hypothetical protein
MVVAMMALALLAWTGALYAEQDVVPVETNADAGVGIGGETGGGVAAEEAGTTANSVTGWVVDAGGWLGMGFDGAKHQQDAVASANMGSPLVILTEHGSVVYPVTLTVPSSPKTDNARLIPFAGQRVTVTGQVVRRGRERGIVIETVAKAAGTERTVSFPDRETANVQIVARVADLSCWVGKGESGAAHVQCAQACAKAGEPLVLVSDSGYIYYPVGKTMPAGPADVATLMQYCEQKVTVTGKLIERGRERAIMIDNVVAYAPGPVPGSVRSGK